MLIIIGLLIAGITGGATLIKSSELRAVMGEARGYAVAVNAFYTQYGAYPGDFKQSIGATAYVGDGNNQIEYCASGGCSGASPFAGSESAVAWQQLSYAGAISAAPTPLADNAAHASGINNPASKTKANGWEFDYIIGNGSTITPQNVVVLTGSTAAGATTSNTLVNGITPVATAASLATDVLSIDTKIDDGNSITGKVRGVLTSCIFNTTGYNVSATTKVCALSYQVDVNS